MALYPTSLPSCIFYGASRGSVDLGMISFCVSRHGISEYLTECLSLPSSCVPEKVSTTIPTYLTHLLTSI